jgi:formylglycine-generating enzyme required for sulfatase activity
MGQVWQATDLATHAELGHSEQVAVKILPPQLTQSPVHARLLVEEATQARRLAHDNIVRVYEWAQDPATASYFIIMEYLDGQDLDAWLKEHGPVPFGEVERILRPVASALQYAWDRHRLVHRDLKPGNVFLTAQGDIKLLDFGIAARSRDGDTHAGAGLPQLPNAGTAGYRAPETGTQQARPTPKLDVYAVAVMVYQMLAGAMPFDGTREAQGPAQTAMQLPPDAPPGLNDAQWQVLRKGFAIDHEERFDTVTALLDALRRAAGPSPEELAAQAAAARLETERREHERQRAQLKEAQERLHAEQRAMEQARVQEAAEQRRLGIERQVELTARRQAEAQAAALKKVREDAARRELEKEREKQREKERERQRRLEAEAAAQARKEQLRLQLIAHREADAAKARAIEEEKQRKAALLKAQAAYRAEQERARRDQAARNAAELAALMPTAASPVADPSGVLRDRFLDGTAVGPDLVLIPTGRFQMGGTEHEHVVARKAGSQASWLARELPAHWVGIERSFALGRYPVTVGEWRRFVRATAWESKLDIDWSAPGFEQDDWHPVVNVSWHDAQQYARWLSVMTGAPYRLPSEAEWEYACRAGSRTAFSFGDDIGTDYANYDGHFTYGNGVRGESRRGTSKVGSFQPNQWGLYDMHGNVWEWTQDAAHEHYDGAPADGTAWEEGGDPARRMVRGGAWLYPPRYLRSAVRNGFSAVLSNDVVGFRVARRLG